VGHWDILTEAEFDSCEVNPSMLERIESHRSRLGTGRAAFRILDFGCGRGKLVLRLREHGYDAVGVELDPRPFEFGAGLYRSRGHQPEACLFLLDGRGRSPFPDSSFDFVVSSQVLEHVDDLGRVVAELRRVTRAGGEGFHIYPPHRRPVEPHLFMPLVHWMPKGWWRRQLIAACVALGVEPYWWPRDAKPRRERVAEYYDFSVRETYYRSPAVLRSEFGDGGFDTSLVDVETENRFRRRLARIGLGPSSPLIRAWTTTFGHNVGLATRLSKAR
jgi:SAM-dependent methyltransferase